MQDLRLADEIDEKDTVLGANDPRALSRVGQRSMKHVTGSVLLYTLFCIFE